VSLARVAERTSGYAIASLVLGIVGFFALPIVASILAIVFGHKAREEIRNGTASGDGFATAGIVLGWVGVVVGVLLVLGILFLLA
jgi:Domain of unknown function (DUF4190)